jgi:ribosomal-protein-alanine N-acetyltransferase
VRGLPFGEPLYSRVASAAYHPLDHGDKAAPRRGRAMSHNVRPEIAAVFGDLPEIRTERLRLRRMTLADAADMFDDARDPEMTRYTTWQPHRSSADSRARLERVVGRYARGEVANWGVEHRSDGRFIGTAGYMRWDVDDHCAELGYAISRNYWGQGLMTEALRAIIAFGFERMQLNRIEARCTAKNVGSYRVMERAGMTFEGTLRERHLVEGDFTDKKLYSILRREYEARV